MLLGRESVQELRGGLFPAAAGDTPGEVDSCSVVEVAGLDDSPVLTDPLAGVPGCRHERLIGRVNVSLRQAGTAGPTVIGIPAAVRAAKTVLFIEPGAGLLSHAFSSASASPDRVKPSLPRPRRHTRRAHRVWTRASYGSSFCPCASRQLRPTKPKSTEDK